MKLKKNCNLKSKRIIFSKKSKEYQGNEDSQSTFDYIKNLENFKLSDIKCKKLKFDVMEIENASLKSIIENQS